MAEAPSSRLIAPLLRRPRSFRLARGTFRLLQRSTVGVRRGYYVRGDHRQAVERLPRQLRQIVGLDDESAIETRRLEIGGGPHAQAGFVHVDIDPGAHHLEWIAPAWDLPLPDEWAQEILAIHALEHVEPPRLQATLSEWRRVLAPGGRVRVHVPNGPALMEAFKSSSVEEKWPIMGSLLGMYCGPGVRDPSGLELRSDHQLIFDTALLSWALTSAGFVEFRDLTGVVQDRHTEAWRPLVSDYSLIAEALKPSE